MVQLHTPETPFKRVLFSSASPQPAEPFRIDKTLRSDDMLDTWASLVSYAEHPSIIILF